MPVTVTVFDPWDMLTPLLPPTTNVPIVSLLKNQYDGVPELGSSRSVANVTEPRIIPFELEVMRTVFPPALNVPPSWQNEGELAVSHPPFEPWTSVRVSPLPS